jgi:hypothetical protein
MRIFGVDVTDTEPHAPPVPGRAQAWESIDHQTGAALTSVRFADEQHNLTTHAFETREPLPATHENRSTIAILASHPNDVQSAIASYRVLGWTFIGEAPPADFDRCGYALALLISHAPRN